MNENIEAKAGLTLKESYATLSTWLDLYGLVVYISTNLGGRSSKPETTDQVGASVQE